MSLKNWALIAGLVIVGMVIAYGAFILYVSWPVAFGNVDKAGVFGDSFGILTSLFSGLAFAGIVFTILLQREELALQRKELELTRGEMRSQVDAMKHQNFENTFFQMLRLHNDIVNSIDLRDRKTQSIVKSGRECFVTFYNRYVNVHNSLRREGTEQAHIEYVYQQFWVDHQSDLGHYFRYLYTIFKFIKESDAEDKKKYTNIIRAQLSDHELAMIFYNCLSSYGSKKFKPLAEEFQLFDNLPLSLLISDNHSLFYETRAFGC